MKMLPLIIAMAFFTVTACNSGDKDKSEENKNENTEIAVEDNSNESSSDTESVNIIEEETVSGSIKLTKAKFIEKVWDYESNPETWMYKGDKPAIIDFYADWCRPCKIAGPILDELAKEYAGEIYIYKVNTETEQELATVFGITGIPAFLYIPINGQPVMTSGIAQTDEQTKSMFKENIDKILLNSNE